MANCEALILQDIAPNCANPIVKGLERNAVIVNREDIDFGAIVYNASRPNVVEDLPLLEGKRGYGVYVYGDAPFTGTKTSMVVGTHRNTFTNDFSFVILDNDPDIAANVIDGLANGDFVVVFENKYKNASKATTPNDSAFQIFGLHQALNATAIENDKYSDDTEGGWTVTLQETQAPHAGMFLYKTSYATTKALFDSLTQ